MYERTKNPVYSNEWTSLILNALLVNPAAALLITPKLRLFTAVAGTLSPTTLTADFTDATFDGYTEFAIAALDFPVNLPAGNGQGALVSKNWTAADPPAPAENIAGYYIVANSLFIMGEVFEAPVPISVGGDFLSLDVILAIIQYPAVDA